MGCSKKHGGIILHTSWCNKKSPLRSACTNIIISRNEWIRFLIQCSASKIFDANSLRRLSNSWKDSTSSIFTYKSSITTKREVHMFVGNFPPKTILSTQVNFHSLTPLCIQWNLLANAFHQCQKKNLSSAVDLPKQYWHKSSRTVDYKLRWPHLTQQFLTSFQ